MSGFESLNFEFLRQHDDRLAHYAAIAEQFAMTDPNTSMLKARQFGEHLARHAVARLGIDPTAGQEFCHLISLMRRERLIDADTQLCFEHVRTLGNAAAHEGGGDRRDALVSLMAAHKLANWFHGTYGGDPEFQPRPFRPPPSPQDVTQELGIEIDRLRDDAARSHQQHEAAHRKVNALEEIRLQLLQEAESHYSKRVEAEQMLAELTSRQQADQEAINRQMNELREHAKRQSPSELNSFIERSRNAARAIGHRAEGPLPITRLRMPLRRKSGCHNADLIAYQYSSGAFIMAYCAECFKNGFSVFPDDLEQLNLWISCPSCEIRMKPGMVRSNYGYRCPKCEWSCFLGSLLPFWNEIPQRS